MPKLVSLAIPQPCSESWAAMIPTTQGRHCAACPQTVVDFTLKTDAEILAYLASAAGGSACGRFAAGQLKRPLQRAAPAAPIRWRAWLAAAVAVWALRETSSAPARGQTPTEMRKMGKVRSVSIERQAQRKSDYEGPVLTLRGVVLDSATREGLPGVTVHVPGTTIGVSTDAAGRFSLELTGQEGHTAGHTVAFSSLGYLSQAMALPGVSTEGMKIILRPDNIKMGEVVVMGGIGIAEKPWPWHPRRFLFWSKYWLTRLYRGS